MSTRFVQNYVNQLLAEAYEQSGGENPMSGRPNAGYKGDHSDLDPRELRSMHDSHADEIQHHFGTPDVTSTFKSFQSHVDKGIRAGHDTDTIIDNHPIGNAMQKHSYIYQAQPHYEGYIDTARALHGMTEAFVAEQHSSYNIPTGITDVVSKAKKKDERHKSLAADRLLDRAVDVTGTLASANPISGMPFINAGLRDIRGIRDLRLGVGQDIGTDEYEGRRAQGVQDRLAAGEQTAPPSGGQAMGMRATSPGHEKRIEDLTHARRRAPGVTPAEWKRLADAGDPEAIAVLGRGFRANPADMTKGASGMPSSREIMDKLKATRKQLRAASPSGEMPLFQTEESV